MYGDKTQQKYTWFKRGKRKRERVNVLYYITEKEFQELREQGKTMQEIAKTINFPLSYSTFNAYVKDLGWGIGEKVTGKSTVLEVNEGFFDGWSRDSAWLFGWLLTDGSVCSKSWQIRLMLHRQDKDVLLKIKDMLGFAGNVYDGVQKDGRVFSYLRICRKKMVKDLFKLGIPRKNKTFTITMPEIPNDYYWDFIRGVFEGDGGIRHRTGNTDALDITISGGSEKFMKGLQTSLETRGIFMRMYVREAGSSCGNLSNVYALNTRSNADALRMCYFMYLNTPRNRRLDRKFRVYQNYIMTYYDTVNRRSKQCKELVELARHTAHECCVINESRERYAV